MLYYLTINNKQLKVRLARSPAQKTRGLMDTPPVSATKLKRDEGMLFVYNKEDILSFWMKNTSIPLEIAFIGANGEINQIETLKPYNQNAVKSLKPAQYALEVNKGWFNNNQIKVGDKVVLPNLHAIKIRLSKS